MAPSNDLNRKELCHNMQILEIRILFRDCSLVLRRVIAREMGVPTEKIRPVESNILLCSVMGSKGFVGCLFGGPYGFDVYSVFTQLELGLEREFGIRVPLGMEGMQKVSCFLDGSDDGCENGKTFSQWVKEVTQEVQTILEARQYDFDVDEFLHESPSKERELHRTQFFCEWSLILGILTFFISLIPIIGSIAILFSPICFLSGGIGLLICLFRRDYAGVWFAIMGSVFCGLAIGNCIAMNNAFYKFFLQ